MIALAKLGQTNVMAAMALELLTRYASSLRRRKFIKPPRTSIISMEVASLSRFRRSK